VWDRCVRRRFPVVCFEEEGTVSALVVKVGTSDVCG